MSKSSLVLVLSIMSIGCSGSEYGQESVDSETSAVVNGVRVSTTPPVTLEAIYRLSSGAIPPPLTVLVPEGDLPGGYQWRREGDRIYTLRVWSWGGQFLAFPLPSINARVGYNTQTMGPSGGITLSWTPYSSPPTSW